MQQFVQSFLQPGRQLDCSICICIFNLNITTIFLHRSYAQLGKYIYVDERDMNVSINYLRSMQDRATGCFRTEGRVAHKAMKVRTIYADQIILILSYFPGC